MGPAANWLSFSLSPLEMLRSSSESTQFLLPFDSSSSASHQHHHQQQQYLFDNFYAHTTTNNIDNHNNNNVWNNQKPQMLFTEEDDHHHHHNHHQGKAILTTSFIECDNSSNINNININNNNVMNHSGEGDEVTQTVPKLEDFLGECSTTTQGDDTSSLTQIYDQAVAAAGFQAFSANSAGSEVDDSASIATRNELAFTAGFTNASIDHHHNHGMSQQSLVDQKSIVASDVRCSNKNSNKVSETFGHRTSIYRGVTRHRWTGRYEAHLWDNSCRREGQARKGRQVYLGGYDKEDKAARSYDLAALKYWGLNATTNFPVSTYTKELEEMKHATKQEFIASLRRKSSGFSRGASIYRGVTRHHQQGRWQARIGRVAGNKDLYLGTFATEEEAAEAYDIAAIKFRGANAVTNFEMNRYDVEAISKSALPVGGAAKRLKLSLDSAPENKPQQAAHDQCNAVVAAPNFSALPPASSTAVPCGIPFDSSSAYYHQNYYHHVQQQPNYVMNAEASGISAAAMVPQPSDFYMWPPHQSY